ncbi:MAG: hypothetical protein R3223_12400 [Longimicrobiales bacterium]|nr:hypothetical protein [Longimicrobiales bacterium]
MISSNSSHRQVRRAPGRAAPIPVRPPAPIPRRPAAALLGGVALAAGALLGFTGTARAQESPTASEEPRVFVGGGLWFAQPRGEFADYVDSGFGLDLNARIAFDEAGVVSLRGDLGFLQYGRETRQVCFSATVGCRILLDLTTSNDIFVGGIGPEVAIPGRTLRPYLFGTIGFTYFSTRSSLEGTSGTEEIAETENFGDGTLAWVGGGGMDIRLSRGRVPVDLDLGVEYHSNGSAEYLREGDIIDNPDGSITLLPTKSETNFTTFRIGVRVGIPRDTGEESDPFF